jgi:hypothetical protein
MPRNESEEGQASAYLAEFDFIREGMRQDQRERQGFLGFALAASGLVLGLLMRSTPPRSATQACFLVGLAAVVILIAERLTIRASQGVASAGAYLRVFVEPHVDGLEYQRRNESYIRKMKGSVSASRGFGLAYVALTFAFACAWAAAPVPGHRQWWQTGFVTVAALISLLQSGVLIRTSFVGWENVNSAWKAVLDEEEQATETSPVSTT